MLRKLDPVTEITTFAAQSTLYALINDTLNKVGTHCNVFGQIGSILDTLTGLVGEYYAKFVSMLDEVFTKIEQWFAALYEDSLIASIVAKIEEFISAVMSGINSLLSAIDSMLDMISDAVAAALIAGCSVVEGALSTMNSSLKQLNPTISSVESARSAGTLSTVTAQVLTSRGMESLVGSFGSGVSSNLAYVRAFSL